MEAPKMLIISTPLSIPTVAINKTKPIGREQGEVERQFKKAVKNIGEIVEDKHKLYLEKLKNKGFRIKPLEQYINAITKIRHKCEIDGYEWNSKPNNVLCSIGNGCPKCSGRIKKTHSEYVSQIKNKLKHIDVIGVYKNANTPILHICKIHNILWKASPSNLLSASAGCKLCKADAIKKLRIKTHELYVKQVYKKNKNIAVVGNYNGDGCKIMHKCMVCENT